MAPPFRPRSTARFALVLLTLAAAGSSPAALAQESGYGQTLGNSTQEQQIYGPSRGTGGSILDTANPIDLMNRIRRSTAMNEATPPGSAIDSALRDYDSQTRPPAPAGAGQPLPGP